MGVSLDWTLGAANGPLSEDSPFAVHLNGLQRLDGGRSLQGMLYDLERIEVWSGPQPLLGHAEGGALNLVWKESHAGWEFTGDALGGDADRYQARSVANLPLLGEGDERLTARIVGQVNHHAPHDRVLGENLSDANDWSGRATLRSVLSEDLTISAHGYRSKTEPVLDQLEVWGADGMLEWWLPEIGGSRVALTVAAGVEFIDDQSFGFAESDARFGEVRLRSDDDGSFRWAIGIEGFTKERQDAGSGFTSMADTDETSYAPFAAIAWSPSESVELSAGARWQRDRVRGVPGATIFPIFVGPAPIERVTRKWSGEVALQWSPTESHRVWLRGARAQDPGLRDESISFGEESVDEVSLGWDWQINAHRLRLVAYDREVRDRFRIQLLEERTTARGIEASIDLVPIAHWRTRLTASLVDARVRAGKVPVLFFFGLASFDDVQGLEVAAVPDWTASIISSYELDLGELGTFMPIVRFGINDEWLTASRATAPIGVGTRTDLALRWTSPHGTFGIEAFVENLEDGSNRDRGDFFLLSTAPFEDAGFEPGRIYGIRVRASWGARGAAGSASDRAGVEQGSRGRFLR